jgi:hypothetical protein
MMRIYRLSLFPFIGIFHSFFQEICPYIPRAAKAVNDVYADFSRAVGHIRDCAIDYCLSRGATWAWRLVVMTIAFRIGYRFQQFCLRVYRRMMKKLSDFLSHFMGEGVFIYGVRI